MLIMSDAARSGIIQQQRLGIVNYDEGRGANKRKEREGRGKSEAEERK